MRYTLFTEYKRIVDLHKQTLLFLVRGGTLEENNNYNNDAAASDEDDYVDDDYDVRA